MKMKFSSGFTLIELSIVLVIIGLVVGGVLVGQDLVAASYVRATVTQIERYQQAVNTFRGKYGSLPGDIPDPDATRFGFTARGANAGEGDGNGVIEGNYGSGAYYSGAYLGIGESGLFWRDLSTAGLITGSFSTAPNDASFIAVSKNSTPSFNAYVPPAALGGYNFVYAWSGSWSGIYHQTGTNVFTISGIYYLSGATPAVYPSMTVGQAYGVDAKIDDGMPQSGRVQATYDFPTWWAGGAGTQATPIAGAAPGTAASSSATTCYDNAGVASAAMRYSLSGSPNAANCTVSIPFQ